MDDSHARRTADHNLQENVEALADHLASLQAERRRRVTKSKASASRRLRLTGAQRQRILDKTGGRCHICGGSIDEQGWQADHVLAHGSGGTSSEDNYLPAHSLCNNYRWHYTAEELQLILKLGVWARTQIQRLTKVGRLFGAAFLDYERRRVGRQKDQGVG